MKVRGIHLGLALCFTIVSAIPTFSQNSDALSQSATKTVAAVYVQTAKGVNVYDASAAGKLTLVKGSPFPTSGQMEGVNGKYLISVGTTNIHSYAIASSGAVGKQASVINTQDYSGSECGATSSNGVSNGAVLDHTGKYFYVQLWGAFDSDGYLTCSAWQTYQLNSSGELVFLGDTEDTDNYHGSAYSTTVPTISGNDLYGFAICYCNPYAPTTVGFHRESNDVFDASFGIQETDPETNPALVNQGGYFPSEFAADPSNHLAAWVYMSFGSIAPQLASYTIDYGTGAITSTNTWENMPTPVVAGPLKMSPSGKLLAVGGSPGLEVFHFNGAAPITSYSGVLLPAVDIDRVAWDTSNHMYALSYESQKLYVYTVTPTTITAVASYSVPAPYGSLGMTVVPR